MTEHPTTRDPFIDRLVQSSALAVHDAEHRLDEVWAQQPEAPRIADENTVTAEEAAAIRAYLPRADAWAEQRDAARADVAHARAAHADAVRLATGQTVSPEGASVVAHGVNRAGAGALSPHPRPSSPPAPSPPARPRARGAGRPRARRASSSSATAGQDPGDDGDPPRPPARPPLLTFEALHRLTPGLPGHWRRRLFSVLPRRVQDAMWRDLAERAGR